MKKLAVIIFFYKSILLAQSVLESGRLYKLEIGQEGVYKLDKSFFNILGESGFNPQNVRLFYNGGKELDINHFSNEMSDPPEVSIWVRGQEDGQFDDNDYILFYAKSSTGIFYNETTKSLESYTNEQSNNAYAILSIGGAVQGKRLVAKNKSSSGEASVIVEAFQDLSFIENDKTHFSITGKRFFDAPIVAGEERSFKVPVIGIRSDREISYRFKFISQVASTSALKMLEGTNEIVTKNLSNAAVSRYVLGREETLSQTLPTAAVDGDTSLVVISLNGTERIYPDKLDILYWRKLEVREGFLKFNNIISLNSPQTVQYNLSGFMNDLQKQVWNITDLQNIEMVSTSTSLTIDEDPSQFQEYVAFSNSYSFKTPKSYKKIENQNLKNIATSGGREYIIIHPDALQSAAKTLLNFRTDKAIWGDLALSGASVSLEKIYNEFSCGTPDFTAVRNFLHYLYHRSAQKPKYVLLMGDGDWDYRNILTSSSGAKLPVFESNETVKILAEGTMTDDFFSYLDGDDTKPDIAIGRIPVSSLFLANQVVNKIIDYEKSSQESLWRNRVLFVADDGPNGSEGVNTNLVNQFTEDAEKAIDSLLTVNNAVKSLKLYLGFYETDFQTASGELRRPKAKETLENQINRGAIAVCYIGHGNPLEWTAEALLSASEIVEKLTNSHKLSLVVTATCDFARIDDPNIQSGAELLLRSQKGGAIALISTTRSILISTGSATSAKLMKELFTRNMDGSIKTIGDAVMDFKVQLKEGSAFLAQSDIDKFILIGDPAMRLVSGKQAIKIDSINGQSVEGVEAPTQIKALSKVSLSGSIRNLQHSILHHFNGEVFLSVLDAAQAKHIDNDADSQPDGSYDTQESFIFRSSATVKDGKFSTSFVVPKTITYNETRKGMISMYAYKTDTPLENALGNLETSAEGGFNNFLAFGTDQNALDDKTPPVVEVFLDDESFISGGVVTSNPLLIVKTYDESGINLTRSPGQGILLIIDDDKNNAKLLNEYYQSQSGFKEGKIIYDLLKFEQGSHSIRLQISDTHGNQAEKFVTFVVGDESRLEISRLLNYPNPFERETYFSFESNQQGVLDIQVKIYTITGRLIKIIPYISSGERRVQIYWDGIDADGDRLANGVYFYKVVARNLMTNQQAEKIEKLVIYR